MEWPLVVRASPLKTDTWASKPAGPEESRAPVKCALDKNRTRQQKCLCDRNSPTCTLSQNGYGETCSQTLESQSELLQNKNLLLLQCLKPKPEFSSLLNLLHL